MLNQLTLWDTPSAISLPALEDGESPAVLPAGPTTEESGRPRARANHSRSPAKAPELLMHGTYGPTFSASSVPEGPLQSWENRLRQRLARIGSTECELTWKASPTPAGVLLSRLVPSTPRTVEIDSGLLLETAYWVTCTTRDHKDTPGMSLTRPDGRSRCDLSRQLVAAAAAYWSTPRASDGEKGGPNQSFGAGGQPLPAQAYHTAMWPSPTLPSGGQTWPAGTTLAGKKPDGTKAQVTLQNVVTAIWPTPMAGTPAQNGNSEAGNNDSSRKTVSLADGTVLDGSSATTGKRGVLNPAFPCWLMGYPLAHLSCGGTAMQLFRKLPRKSSQL